MHASQHRVHYQELVRAATGFFSFEHNPVWFQLMDKLKGILFKIGFLIQNRIPVHCHDLLNVLK